MRPNMYRRPTTFLLAPATGWVFSFGELPRGLECTRAVYEVFDAGTQVGVSATHSGVRHAVRAPIIDDDLMEAVGRACDQLVAWFSEQDVAA